MGIVVIRVMLVRSLGLITARIMPTPGTEIAKASLADSSPVWSLPGQDVDFSSGAAAYGAGQRPSGCVKGACRPLLMLTPALFESFI